MEHSVLASKLCRYSKCLAYYPVLNLRQRQSLSAIYEGLLELHEYAHFNLHAQQSQGCRLRICSLNSVEPRMTS